jgi:hypothetical protein
MDIPPLYQNASRKYTYAIIFDGRRPLVGQHSSSFPKMALLSANHLPSRMARSIIIAINVSLLLAHRRICGLQPTYICMSRKVCINKQTYNRAMPYILIYHNMPPTVNTLKTPKVS